MSPDGSAEERQSPEAKRAWGRSVTRDRASIFPFDRYPELVGAVREQLPEHGLVLLLGGGRGYLGSMLAAPGRTVFNLDLAPGGVPFVPSAIADIEAPLPVRPGRSGGATTAVAAFALEYTDVRVATSRTADVLAAGERLVWICHHSDSAILRDLRAGRSAARLAHEAVRLADSGVTADRLCALAADLAAQARAAGDPARETEVARLTALAAGMATSPRADGQARTRLAALARRLSREAEMSEAVVSRPMRSARDLLPLVDERLTPRLGGCVRVDGAPLGILTVFVRA
ncbi:MAG: hypothetical protein ACOY3Y_04935 [Acidobacteriota bacterium]